MQLGSGKKEQKIKAVQMAGLYMPTNFCELLFTINFFGVNFCLHVKLFAGPSSQVYKTLTTILSLHGTKIP